MSEKERRFARIERLIGVEMLSIIQSKRVLLLGVGGVGSWCAESLVRSGITQLTMVDPDDVDITNINRQLPASTSTVGKPKVEVMAERLRDINPDLQVTISRTFYSAETADEFNLDSYDYIIDAIDALGPKALLILRATASKATFFSSMGAALKLDPSHVHIDEFWKVKGCPLARALRQRFKRSGIKPSRKFKCVYSDELLTNLGDTDEQCNYKAQINGTMAPVTAIFGFTLASMVTNDIIKKYQKDIF